MSGVPDPSEGAGRASIGGHALDDRFVDGESLDAEQQYRALRHGVGAVWLDRDVVEVTGDDAASYLQGQLSQDVEALEPGDSAWSFVLQPQGRVDAFVRVTRTSTGFLIDTDGGSAAALVARLERFNLRVKVEIVVQPWPVLGLRGPDVDAVLPAAVDSDPMENEAQGASGGDLGIGSVIAPLGWPALTGVDVIGPDPAVPVGVPLCDLTVYEAIRIEAGLPAMGRELDDRTIPGEAGVNHLAVSFTKGCYTGQELVARIDSRGDNTPRRLRGVVIDAAPDAAIDLGAEVRVEADERPLGALTSVAWSPGADVWVALALLRRGAEVPGDATVATAGGPAPARLVELPIQP